MKTIWENSASWKFFKQFLDKDRAKALAAAWSGDRYGIYENQKDKRTLLVFRIRLATDADAARFFGAYSEVLEMKYGTRTNLLRRPNFFSFDTPEDGVFLPDVCNSGRLPGSRRREPANVRSLDEGARVADGSRSAEYR